MSIVNPSSKVNIVDMVSGEGRRGWDGWRELLGNIYVTVCKVDSQWKFAV